jgi:hypothetical protein
MEPTDIRVKVVNCREAETCILGVHGHIAVADRALAVQDDVVSIATIRSTAEALGSADGGASDAIGAVRNSRV